MQATNFMIEEKLLLFLETMARKGVPIRDILMRAVADSIVADPDNGVTEYLNADKLVKWYVDSMINIRGAE